MRSAYSLHRKIGVKLMDPEKRIEIEAATFRHLVNYLRENTNVQNIDLMMLFLKIHYLMVNLCETKMIMIHGYS